MIARDRLKELVDYDPETGVFTWKVSRPNGIYPGMIAGQTDMRGYGRISLDGKRYKLHRLAYLYYHGFVPSMLDHIDGDTVNNRISNLRPCTGTENNLNRSYTKANQLKIKNVHQDIKSGKYIVQVLIEGKRQYLGRFDDLELAELVATEARNKHYGLFNRKEGVDDSTVN